MRILHFDCSMGAAGDMLTAALLELTEDRSAALARLNAMGVPGVCFEAVSSVKCGVTGTHLRVTVSGREEGEPEHEHPHEHEHEHSHEHEHHEHEHSHEHESAHGHAHQHSHRSMAEIEAVVRSLVLPEEVKAHVLEVYRLIAEAESAVHGTEVSEIHFHEVGSLDAIADVAGFSLLLHELSPDRITASPVHVGSGQVRCAHGVLPVPAPATALLLRDVPIYGGQISGELCTPTGAALLKHYVNSFGPMPVLMTEKIGYGMGKKDFPAANCVRAFWGREGDGTDEMLSLECNLDDMTPEQLGYACQILREAGAAEVYTQPAFMKKDRPGVVLKVICRPALGRAMAELILRHTTTIGVREIPFRRYVLSRRTETAETPFGPVRKKLSSGYGVEKYKYEYDDLARIAREQDMTIPEVLDQLN